MKRTHVFLLLFATIFVSIIIFNSFVCNKIENKEVASQNKTSTISTKTETIAHYGKSAEVELLKLGDNNWRLENYNDFFVTIRHVAIAIAYGAGETTQSVQRIGAKGYINLKNLCQYDGFYIYDSYGVLSGWIRVGEPLFTEK